MAFLKPDRTYTIHGLTISEKLIGPESGVRYYSGRKLSTPNHKPAWITIHNTPDINEAAGTNDAEQYARATYNNNMGDVVVHYYIDETGCWHILADDTVGYHAANKEANDTSIAIEIVMDGSGKSYDKEAEDRGALLAAILLDKYNLPIEQLTTHYKWYPKKYCPCFILPHWDAFKAKVEKYLKEIQGGSTAKTIYYVQVGSYALKKNAEIAEKTARALGFSTTVKQAKVLLKTVYRVQIGAFSNRANAEAYAEKARKKGLQAVVRSDV